MSGDGEELTDASRKGERERGEGELEGVSSSFERVGLFARRRSGDCWRGEAGKKRWVLQVYQSLDRKATIGSLREG